MESEGGDRVLADLPQAAPEAETLDVAVGLGAKGIRYSAMPKTRPRILGPSSPSGYVVRTGRVLRATSSAFTALSTAGSPHSWAIRAGHFVAEWLSLKGCPSGSARSTH